MGVIGCLKLRHLPALCGLAAAFLLITSTAALADPSVLSPSPTAWDFGNSDVHNGNGPSQNFSFTNASQQPVSVKSDSVVGADGPSFHINSDGCKGAWLGPAMACDIQVVLNADTTGPQAALLELTDDSGTLDLPLSGNGITGTLSASPNPLIFSPQPWYNGGQQQGINIQNSGDAGTLATSMNITGPDASRFYIAWGQNCANQLFGPGSNCGIGIGFNPPNGPGTFHAQLELDSDSLSGPTIVRLSATALNGPHAVITPLQTEFGAVAIGKSAVQTIAVSNQGDAPMQIQQAFMITGSPAVLPILADSCLEQTIEPGSKCQLTVAFHPDSVGYREGAVIMITNGPDAVTPIGFSGTGTLPPAGAVAVTGTAAAGSDLTCRALGYPDGTSFAYQWLRDGLPAVGAQGRTFPLLDSDVGGTFSCRVVATNAVAVQTSVSAGTAPVLPMSLTRQSGAFTNERVCRDVQTGHAVHLGRNVAPASFGSPATPWTPLTLSSAVALKASIDGRGIAAGRTVTISPRALSAFADGSHTFVVSGGGATARSRLLLGPCWLAARLDGGPGQAATLSASSRYGMSGLTFALPHSLNISATTGHRLGWVTFRTAGFPDTSFDLDGSRTRSNDVLVKLTGHTVSVSNLPPETGVVSIRLRPGVLSGRPGALDLAARVRGSSGLQRASTNPTWLP